MSVAVIIPNFNNAPYLRGCISSVESDPAVGEIVVYDNASSDNSIGVIEKIASPKIRLIKGAENLGATRARHVAIESTQCPYLFTLDGDDYVAEGTVSAGLERARERHLDLAVPEMVRVSVDEREFTPFVPAPEGVFDGAAALMMTIGGWRIHPMGVMRRETYLAGAERFQFHGFSDDELLTRHILMAATRIGGSPGTYFYRWVPKQASVVDQAAQIRTHLRALALASTIDEPSARETVRVQRNGAVLSILAYVRQSGAALDPGEVRGLLKDVEAIRAPWRLGDLRFRAAAAALGPYALLRRRRRRGRS